MSGRSGPVVFQPGEAVLLEVLHDLPDMSTRQSEIAGDALLMPTLVIEADDRPARLIGVIELMEPLNRQWELHRDRVPLEEASDLVVVGVAPIFALDDPRDLAVVDGRIELFQVQDV